MRWAAALALALAGGAALAQEGTELAPGSAPTPEARPGGDAPRLIPPEDTEAPAEGDTAATPSGEVPQLIPPEEMEAEPPAGGFTLTPPDDAEEDAGLSFRLPEAAPEDGGMAPEADAPPAAPKVPEPPPGPPMREVLAETPAELSACLAALDRLGVTYERADPIADPADPDCGIANPLTVSGIAPGVALDPPPTLRCEAALAAARWVADVAIPLSRKLPGRGPLAAIDQGTAYLCRPRADGETSEHAFGNALDVMGFRFESGDPIRVEPRAGDGTLDEAFQRAVRAGACLDFTTVLGPGSDADHADHLHLDVKARDGGFRLCR